MHGFSIVVPERHGLERKEQERLARKPEEEKKLPCNSRCSAESFRFSRTHSKDPADQVFYCCAAKTSVLPDLTFTTTMAEAIASLKLIREAAAACAVQLSQLFPADFGLDDAHAEIDAPPLVVACSNSRQQRQRRDTGDHASIAESWLEIFENGDLPFHAIIIAYLDLPEKLRMQETCKKLNSSLQKPAWKELDLTYVQCKQGDNDKVSYRAGPEQLTLYRAVIAQPKYSLVYSVCLAGAVMGLQQTPADWGKKKKKNDMGVVGKHLVQELTQALPNVQSLHLRRAYLQGKAGRPVLPPTLIRDSLGSLKYLACTASLTLLRPVLSYCKQLAHLHLSCAAAYASQVISNCYYNATESCIIERLCIV
jgi:hypothetical protein